ncbi:tetratricopeptide repeat protein [Aquimonas voraii]|uniref:Tetratricopeptide repeat-containing protein n=1 Tax=Aquimonas voraii TaxID=265719 RepID=A0A1G6X7L1_9GAMM|nr:tetratricopeptide repeat protein [Aquimonas voraii]SDD74180.1 hypothetical protein SAMN04488509_10683 [Aquimonas voraii]
MFVKTYCVPLAWALCLGLVFGLPQARAQELPPTDASYVEVDPAAQRVAAINAEDNGARSALESLVRREPRNALARLQYAQMLLDRGLRARVARELDSAERFSEAGSPLRRSVHFNAGWILFRMGDFDGARSQWLQAWQQHGGHPDWVPVAFALALWSQGDRDTALAFFKAELAARPDQWQSAEAFDARTRDMSPGERFALQSMQQALASAR